MLRHFRAALPIAALALAPVAQAQELIDFESLATGTIVTQVFASSGAGPILVDGFNPSLGATDAALIFDSANPTGEDPDLGTPHTDFGGPGVGAGGASGSQFQNDSPLGNILIVGEDLVDLGGDGLVDDPDDADVVGSSLELDFAELAPVLVTGMTIIDVEPRENPSEVSFYDVSDALISTIVLPQPGDNGVFHAVASVSGVHRIVMTLNGSAGFDNVLFRGQDDCNDNGIPDEDDIASGSSADCDRNGVPDECQDDCDFDGIPDVCEPDGDGDGIPNDCEECAPPRDVCDAGCYVLGDTSLGGQAPPDYGLRLDGLFGDWPNVYTFSFEEAGAEVFLCFDGVDTLTISGIAYGGLDAGNDWSPSSEGFLDVNLVYTGVQCLPNGKLVVHKSSGQGFGQVTWMPSGETIQLFGKANARGLIASFDGAYFSGWVNYPGGPPVCCLDFGAGGAGTWECPPEPDCDGDGTPDAQEADCDDDGIPDDCDKEFPGSGC